MDRKKLQRRVVQTRSKRETRPTVAEVDLGILRENVLQIRSRVGPRVDIMAVVKANAYGHGLVPVAKFLDGRLADCFGVATAEEGRELRACGVRKPIHVFTLPAREQVPLFFDFDLEPTVCGQLETSWLAHEGRKRKKTVRVHIKVETGMNRIGIPISRLEPFLGFLGSFERIEVKGIYTHFASADDRNKEFTKKQYSLFKESLEVFARNNVSAEVTHCANSSAILDHPEMTESMVRPGITMYGYYPSHQSSRSVKIRPVMKLRSAVSLVKRIEAGETVSYGRRFTASKATTIATLPIGYADGYTRLLSGQASVIIHGKRYPVVGTICMDQMMVDIGDDEVQAGDEAILFGGQANPALSAMDLADTLRTIPYEILCAVSSRVPRVYKQS